MPNAARGGPPCAAPADVRGPAYVAAYRRGWEARNAGARPSDNPWPYAIGDRPMPGGVLRDQYARLWHRGWCDCGHARMTALAGKPPESVP
jgi:hypothetical protein